MVEDRSSTFFFETERMLLQLTSVEDAPLILELLNTPKWLKYIGDRHVKTLSEAQHYVKERIIPQQKRLGYGSFTMIRKTDQEMLGTCGLFDREGLQGIDMGYGLLPQFEGQGYAFEATTRLKEMAFSFFGLDEIHAITVGCNTGSRNLLVKLGFSLKGTVTLPDDDAVLLLYSLRKGKKDSSQAL